MNTDHHAKSIRTLARYLRNALSVAISTPHVDPLCWAVEIEDFFAMLEVMRHLTRSWEQQLDTDAEADKHAAEAARETESTAIF